MTEPAKSLQRLPQQGKIAGVCAGLAEYFDFDVTLIRVTFIILTIITGGGFILIYILMAIAMPSADAGVESKGSDITQNVKSLARDMRGSEQQIRLRNYIGLGLVALGVWLFLGQLFPGWVEWSWGYIWPIALILLGLFIATRRG